MMEETNSKLQSLSDLIQEIQKIPPMMEDTNEECIREIKRLVDFLSSSMNLLVSSMSDNDTFKQVLSNFFEESKEIKTFLENFSSSSKDEKNLEHRKEKIKEFSDSIQQIMSQLNASKKSKPNEDVLILEVDNVLVNDIQHLSIEEAYWKCRIGLNPKLAQFLDSCHSKAKKSDKSNLEYAFTCGYLAVLHSPLIENHYDFKESQEKANKYAQEALPLINKFAGKPHNHSECQYLLGEFHEQGLGLTKDTKKALRYIQLASKQGHPGALWKLGVYYHKGIGIEKNLEQAINYYHLAAEKGIAEAQYIMGTFYEDGCRQDPSELKKSCFSSCFKAEVLFELKKDPTKAAKYFQEAADQGHVNAQYKIGVFYEKGKGVETNVRKSVHYIKLSAEQGNDMAQCKLGDSYQNGIGLEQDPQQAVHYFQLSAKQGNALAQCNLGDCYKEGQGVENDPSQSVHYYKLSADQGEAAAQYNLGVCYKKGVGVKTDVNQAVQLYQSAAEQGFAKAQNSLGFCYKYGDGVPRDPEKAVHYFQLAADQGDSSAQCNLGACYKIGDGVEEDHEKAAKFYQLAADQGLADGLFKLGVCYALGHGVKEDNAKALEYYNRAAEKGHFTAQIVVKYKQDEDES